MTHSGLVQFNEDLIGLLAPIDDVQQHPENPNNGDLDAIVESIEVNGMYRPIYVQKSTGFIIAGNHTWLACKTLGAEEIPVVYVDVDDTTATRIMIADNRVADLARPDDTALLALLDRLAINDSIRGTGYADHDVEALRLLVAAQNDLPIGFPEVPQEIEAEHRCPACGYEWRGSSRQE